MSSPVLIDDVATCRAAVEALLQEVEVAVDLEGVELGRHPGKICIIQACGRDTPDTVYLFDICALGEEAFEAGHLRTFFESPTVEKVIFDVRSDTDALHHNHRVDVKNAFDLQVLYHLRFDPERIHLPGLKKTFAEFAKVKLTAADRTALEAIKQRGLRLFAPDFGGSYEVWERRPLSQELVTYCAVDVKYLLDMKAFWNTPKLDKLVKEITPHRILEFIRKESVVQSAKKNVDFPVPFGLKSDLPAGIFQDIVHVPANRVGLVIGKRGATIQGIERSSGASCSLDGHAVKIRGTRDEVFRAKNLIANVVSGPAR